MVERVRYGIMSGDGRILSGTSRNYYFETITTTRRLVSYPTRNQALGNFSKSYGVKPYEFEKEGFKLIKIKETIEEIKND